MSKEHSAEEQKAREAFSTMPAGGPQWWAIQWFLNDTALREVAGALQPNLGTEARHFNAGRAAAITDLFAALTEAHAEVFRK